MQQPIPHDHGDGVPCTCPIGVERENSGAPRVVIVGAGFGGLSAAQALAKAPVQVTLIDQRNHHLFQPLLYQVATAGLSPNQIATPIRTIVRGQKNAEVLLGAVTGVDKARRTLLMGQRRIPYDYLILATGARHSYFGRDEWERHAPGMKTLEDATELRKRILLSFERAELENDPAERARLLTFVVIGAGPTGVELAGAIAELAKKALADDFRNINTACARIVLVEGGPRVLPQFHETLSESAAASLACLGVELQLGAPVTAIDSDGVTVGSARIDTRCVVWAAGVESSPAAQWLNIPGDRAGRAIVQSDLSAPGSPEVFIVGDCASVMGSNGKPLPGLAPVAKQQGVYAARAILADIWKQKKRRPFAYADAGSLATIGRKSAVADFDGYHLTGFIGWVVWSLAHIYFLIGFRNRIAVAIDWLWSYLTFERGARLITGPIEQPNAQTPAREKHAA